MNGIVDSSDVYAIACVAMLTTGAGAIPCDVLWVTLSTCHYHAKDHI
jgi:hypothetical protein